MRIEEHSYQVQEINSVNNRRLSLEKAESVNRLEGKDELILQRKSGIDRIGIYNLQQIGNRSEVMESLRLRDEVEGEAYKVSHRWGKRIIEETVRECAEDIRKGGIWGAFQKFGEELFKRRLAVEDEIQDEIAAIKERLIPEEKVAIIKKINELSVRIEEESTNFSFKNAGTPDSIEKIRELEKELRKVDIDDINLENKYLLKEDFIDRILVRKIGGLIWESESSEKERIKDSLIQEDIGGYLNYPSYLFHPIGERGFVEFLKKRLNGKDITESIGQDVKYARDKVYSQIWGSREELAILDEALEKVYETRKDNDEEEPFAILLGGGRKGELLLSSIGANDLVNAVKEKGGVENLTGREICDIIEELRREKGIIRVEVKENEKTDETKEEISSTKKALIEFQKTLGKWLEQKVFNSKIEIEYDFLEEIQNQRQGKDLSEKQEIIQDRYGPVAQNRLHFNQLKLNINGCYRL